MQLARVSSVIMVIVVLVLSLSGQSEAEEEPCSKVTNTSLRQFLSIVPAVATYESMKNASQSGELDYKLQSPILYFTNWSLIKSYLGLENISSQSPMEKRWELINSINKDQAAAAGYALSRFAKHAERWGWDTADLRWEAKIEDAKINPTYILKFNQEFDIGEVIAHFEERGFEYKEYLGSDIYFHKEMFKTEWVGTTELAIQCTAVMPEEKIFILSTHPESVRLIIDIVEGKYSSLEEDGAVSAVVDHLDNSASVVLLPGTGACGHFTVNPILSSLGGELTEEDFKQMEAMLESRSKLNIYDVLGVGYRYQDGQPEGFIIFHYPESSWAKEDLPLRKEMAENGISTRSKQPYSESVFKLANAYVREKNLIFSVIPVNNQPRRLFNQILMADMMLATCP